MNKYEREVALSQLKSERHTLDELKEIYRQAIEEVCEKLEISDGKIQMLLSEIDKADPQMISVLQSKIYQKKFQQNIKKQLDFLLKDLNDNQYASISEYLNNSYDNGFIGTLYSLNMSNIPVNIPIDPALVVRAMYIESKLSKRLYDELGEDVEFLKRKVSSTISRGIASNMHYSDIARNIANNSKTGLNRAMTITRTEGNRIYNTASLHSGIKAKEKTGADLIKQWDSTLDGLTRPHHRQLDGQVRELDEPFEVGNRKAPAPLQFGIPSEDINCRCIALIKPRWDVGEAFTKMDNQTGQLLEFQGVKDYEDFKKRYWESVDKSQKSGIIEDKITYRTTETGKTIATRSILGEYDVKLPDGNISNIKNPVFDKYEVFAGKGSEKELRVRDFLVDNYGGKSDNWFHAKGNTQVTDSDNNVRKANVHWFEEETVGIREMKIKGWSKK